MQHKTRHFEEQNSCWSPLTSIVGKEILWKSMTSNNYLITSILPKIFYVQHNKETHRFGTTWGWVNDDTIKFFGCTLFKLCHIVRLCLPFPCVSTPLYGPSCFLSLVHSSPSVFDLLLTWCCFPWLCYVFISPEFSLSLGPSTRLCTVDVVVCLVFLR